LNHFVWACNVNGSCMLLIVAEWYTRESH